MLTVRVWDNLLLFFSPVGAERACFLGLETVSHWARIEGIMEHGNIKSLWKNREKKGKT